MGTGRSRNANRRRPRRSPAALYGAIAICSVLALATTAVLAGRWNELVAYVAAVNVVTFVLYGYDKAIAGSSALRVPEVVLHLLALIGGSPAALIAQITFHHKTRKTSFQRVYWAIAILQIALLIYLLR